MPCQNGISPQPDILHEINTNFFTSLLDTCWSLKQFQYHIKFAHIENIVVDSHGNLQLYEVCCWHNLTSQSETKAHYNPIYPFLNTLRENALIKTVPSFPRQTSRHMG